MSVNLPWPFNWLDSVPSLLFGQQEPGYVTSSSAHDLGIDFPEVVGTALGNLLPGRVVTADYAPWGGQVDIATILPTGQVGIEEYLHLDTIAVAVGQQVAAGQVIGTSGGQLSGGNHPSSPAFSTGPHIKYSLFTGTQPYATAQNAINPASFLSAVEQNLSNGVPIASSIPFGGGGALPIAPGALPGGIPNPVTTVDALANMLIGWANAGRLFKLTAGVGLLIVGVYILIQPQMKQAALSTLEAVGAAG